ncbi:hypothetical protein PHLCEN_2v2021 [Hermanssonia centrifuga]|uniref:Uncharacterized protein n=1 Tax=Hermanssonia centrifuga TaxID=98765 RepID=A0A2R6RQC1_9APHY|nr:hypothetical protein PHLCEN_2v2021 [Hermanssonia centrifuga]
MPNLPGSSLLRSTHSPLRSNLDVREAQIKSFDTESDLTELSFDEIEGEENNLVLSSPSFLDDKMVTFGLE